MSKYSISFIRNSSIQWKQSTLFRLFLFSVFLLLNISCNAQGSGLYGWSLYTGEGLDNSDMYRLSAVFTDDLMFTETDSGEIYRSTNQGHTWLSFGFFENGYFFHDVNAGKQKNDGSLIASSDSVWIVGNSGVIFFSSNSGDNWIQQSSGLSGDIYTVFFGDSHHGWAADLNFDIIRTTNAGNNWVTVSTTDFAPYAIFFTDTANGWVTGYASKVKYTSNGGANWVDRTPPGANPIGYFWRIQFIDINTGWAAGLGYGTYSLYRTTNGGVHWDSCSVNPAPSVIWGISFVNSMTGFACGPSSVFKTTDGGVSWTSQALPGGTPILYDIRFANADTGFAVGQGGSILYTTTGGEPIGIRPISTNIPKAFELEQNYPNPFNPTTIFKIQISKLSDVKVVVYDVLGRETTTLVNQQLKPGTYEVSWDASNYPSGVYFYQLTVSSEQLAVFKETKRMVLLK